MTLNNYGSNVEEREEVSRYAYVMGEVGLWVAVDIASRNFHSAHPMPQKDIRADLYSIWEHLRGWVCEPVPPKRYLVEQRTASSLVLTEDGSDGASRLFFRTMGTLIPRRFQPPADSDEPSSPIWRVIVAETLRPVT